MNNIKKFGIFSSSVDGNKLSKTVEGGILALSVVIIFVAQKFGIEIGTAQISDLAVTAGSIISTLVILFGLIRKVVVLFTTPKGDITPPIVQVASQDTLPPIEG